MKLAIMQPYLFPYIGYFQLINAVDKFVIYDDVNYINKGWINRNNIIVNGRKALFTISLAKASQNKLINGIEISYNFEKFLETLQFNYSKAAYYKNIINLVRCILSFEDKNLSRFIANSIDKIMKYIGINTELLTSSNIEKDNNLKAQYKIMAICRKLHATTFINPINGIELYNRDYFNANNIELFFIKSTFRPYPQFCSNFEPALSIIDVMMHNSPEDIKQMMNDCELIKN